MIAMLIVVAVSAGEGCACMCIGNTQKHCYRFYPATVVTVPFSVSVCAIIRYSPRSLLY